MSVLLLGPSQWVSRSHTTVPSWVGDLLEGHAAELAAAEPSPLQVRRAFAAFLRSRGRPVLVMEEWPAQDDRVNLRLFRRIVEEAKVQSYAVSVPEFTR
jgi:hypothetical protein